MIAGPQGAEKKCGDRGHPRAEAKPRRGAFDLAEVALERRYRRIARARVGIALVLADGVLNERR